MPQKQRQVRVQEPPPPASVVAKRLCDLLLSFPSAAGGGVQWRVLVAKYEDQYASKLDLEALGHSSPLGAATMLLWDVLRVVDKEDTDNPVVGIEDGLAMTPQPELIACWPSLYQVLCDMVQEDGVSDKVAAEAANLPTGTHFLLLSQLRPLIERRWHGGFDETSLSYRSEDGAVVRFKKIKHLLQALLRWREQRQEWQQECGSKHKRSAVDEALSQKLELVPSKKHNDLMLCCRTGVSAARASSPSSVMNILLEDKDTKMVEVEDASDFDLPETLSSTRASSSSSFDAAEQHLAQEELSEASSCAPDVDAELRCELLRLRAENEKLRVANSQLQRGAAGEATPSKRKARIGRPSGPEQKVEQKACQKVEPKAEPAAQPQQRPVPRLPADLFDDPFEPPPEKFLWAPSPMSCSTPSEVSTLEFSCDFRTTGMFSNATSACVSGARTPIPHVTSAYLQGLSSASASGAMTPVVPQQPAMQAMVPMWFPFLDMSQSLKGMMDVAVIPRGIVQGARQRFENIVG